MLLPPLSKADPEDYMDDLCDNCGATIDIDECLLDDDSCSQFCDTMCQDNFYADQQ